MIYEEQERLCVAPKVSAFIFTYNQQDLVKTTIDSFLAQSCDFEYEICICDDCSTDNTLKVCLEYQKKHPDRIRVFENEKNLGIRGNFIVNIERYARGKYVAYCAGDDWWSDPYKLSKQVSYFEAHPEVSMIHSHARIYIDETKTYSKSFLGKNRNSFEQNVLANGVAALTIGFLKQAFDEYVTEINPIALPFSEDYPMVLWFSYRKKIGFIDEPLCTYRLQTNSLSHTPDKQKIYKGPKDAFDCRMVFINKFRIKDTGLIKKIYLNFYLDRMQLAHLLGDNESIKEGERFFKTNHYYLFFLLSKLYSLAGNNESENAFVSQIGRIIRRLHPSHKYFE